MFQGSTVRLGTADMSRHDPGSPVLISFAHSRVAQLVSKEGRAKLSSASVMGSLMDQRRLKNTPLEVHVFNCVLMIHALRKTL